jgi:predicted RNase H-like HicB family nuclease
MSVDVLNLQIETEQEDDDRWIAEAIGMPGVLAYGKTVEDTISRVQSLELCVVADSIETDAARM